MAAAVTRRRVTDEDILGFLERCRRGLDGKKVGKERESKQRKRAEEGKLSKLCLRSLGMATMDFFAFLLCYC